MNYILLNISFKPNSKLEDILDNKVLKELPFGSKHKAPILSYDNVLIPKVVCPSELSESFKLLEPIIYKSIFRYGTDEINKDIVYSIYNVFNEVINPEYGVSINVLREIDYTKLAITYTDGSSSSKLGAAAYGCCQLLNEDISETSKFDNFTGKSWSYKTYSGRINDGTNNIGELTGLKVAIDNFNDAPFQIIISDSMYGIKSFREYIHVWKNNGYKTYSKKPIKNKELIINTYNKLIESYSNHIVLFKWTEGHASDNFNEMCDVLAKAELGL